MKNREPILVIRLGALGDLILCFQAFHEIRRAHSDAEIILLTTAPFAAFAHDMPWFDHILIDERPAISQWRQWRDLVRRIRAFNPTRIYDLQGKFRQTLLYFLSGCPRGWSGAAPLCSYPRPWPPETDMHFTDFIATQLRRAEVPPQPAADLGWLNAPLDNFVLPEKYAVLIPGCAPGREYKRWPAANYAELANRLEQSGVASIAIGTMVDAPVIAHIRKKAPQVLDLSGQTSLAQLATLLRGSFCVVGNDTGPTHLAAAVGAKTLALISSEVNLVWAAPHGRHTKALRGNPLEFLPADEILLALERLVDKTSRE